MNNTEKRLYSVDEARKILGIGKTKIYDLIRNGYIKALDLGGMKISAEEIDRFINQYSGYSFKDMKNLSKI